MSSPLAHVLKGSARAAHNLLSQVVVSVAAAICVAFITNAYFDRDDPAPSPRQEALSPARLAAPVRYQASDATRAAPAIDAPLRHAPIPLPKPAPKPLPKLEAVSIADVPARAEAARPMMAPVLQIDPNGMPGGQPLQPEPAIAEAPRARLLGVPLPRFVPTPGGVARSVGAAKDRVVSWLPGRDRRGEEAAGPAR